ncbi:uncharacterized protein [Coffea arabica]|uniref:Endonuclease/exonuclease/phosphatase domain-containing protein n=1 Tax=Coffea arabica TaxID=13443 RepID=A0ABM4W309_COFAR
MKALVWNCQGAGSPLTIPQLREACNLLSPNLVFLCETKNRKIFMEKLQKQLRFEESVMVESMNKAGGMAVMWSNEVQVMDVVTTAFTVEVHIMESEANVDWWFIGIYASTDDQIRRNQWEVIERRKGKPWTWSNQWTQEGEIIQRLDRALGSSAWSQHFDRATVKHIENFGSDHSMIFLDANPLREKRKKRFIFDKRWLKKEGVEEVVKQAWNSPHSGSRMYKVHRKIATCKVEILKWRNQFQGNARKNIDKVKKQLEELKDTDCQDKKRRNKMLKRQLKEAYEEEEMFWSQKSRVQWLKEGDRNTHFFHLV